MFQREIDLVERQVAATVWMLATREFSREISDCFNIVMSSVARCLRRVTRAVSDLCSELIQWPSGEKYL